jgi:hypothetical protein
MRINYCLLYMQVCLRWGFFLSVGYMWNRNTGNTCRLSRILNDYFFGRTSSPSHLFLLMLLEIFCWKFRQNSNIVLANVCKRLKTLTSICKRLQNNTYYHNFVKRTKNPRFTPNAASKLCRWNTFSSSWDC